MRLEIEHGQKIWVIRTYFNTQTRNHSFEFEPSYITLEHDEFFTEKKKYHIVVQDENRRYARMVDARYNHIYTSEERALKCKEYYESQGYERFYPFENIDNVDE